LVLADAAVRLQAISSGPPDECLRFACFRFIRIAPAEIRRSSAANPKGSIQYENIHVLALSTQPMINPAPADRSSPDCRCFLFEPHMHT
jgi:hypothetical protein